MSRKARTGRPPPELHVIVRFESATPVVRLHAATAEDEARVVAWLRERPAALLRVEAAVLSAISDLLEDRT